MIRIKLENNHSYRLLYKFVSEVFLFRSRIGLEVNRLNIVFKPHYLLYHNKLFFKMLNR